MSPPGVTQSFSVAFLVLLYLESSCAVNIAETLKGYPNFIKMANVLAQPDVYKQMSIQYAITILALDNDAMDSLSATRTPDQVTNIVKCHVLFDYYDVPKMNNREVNHPAEMVNLYQSSGSSEYGQGLTQLKKTTQGIVFFSTSTSSTKDDAKLLETVYTKQFNISILHVDHPVFIAGLSDQMAPALAPLPPQGGSNNETTPVTGNAPAKGNAPVRGNAPAKGNAPAPGPGPGEDEVVGDSPTDNSFMAAGEAPASAEAPGAGDESSTQDVADEASEDQASSAGKEVVGLSLVFASTLLAGVAF